MKQPLLLEPCCNQCTYSHGQPCQDLIACLDHGPICHDDETCKTLRAERLAAVRGDGTGSVEGKRSVLYVGVGTCGRANGALRVIGKAKAYIEGHGLPVDIIEVGCVGFCQREVFVDLSTADGLRLSFCDVTPENTGELLEALFEKNDLRNRFLYGRYGDAPGFGDVPLVSDTPFFERQTRVVLENCGMIDPASLDAALAAGGFAAAARALTTMTREEVVQLVTASGLRGRGGAGFPTGQKWKVARSTPAAQ